MVREQTKENNVYPLIKSFEINPHHRDIAKQRNKHPPKTKRKAPNRTDMAKLVDSLNYAAKFDNCDSDDEDYIEKVHN